MKELQGKNFRTEDELIKEVEKTTGLEVLGVFDNYINVIDPYSSDGEEYTLAVFKDISGYKLD